MTFGIFGQDTDHHQKKHRERTFNGGAPHNDAFMILQLLTNFPAAYQDSSTVETNGDSPQADPCTDFSKGILWSSQHKSTVTASLKHQRATYSRQECPVAPRTFRSSNTRFRKARERRYSTSHKKSLEGSPAGKYASKEGVYDQYNDGRHRPSSVTSSHSRVY